MYELAEQVRRWSAEGRRVLLARVVETAGISSRDRAAAVAYSPGLPLAGSLFSHAAEAELVALLDVVQEASLRWLSIGDAAAAEAGLSCGGRARLLVEPADRIDWAPLLGQEPACLVTELLPGGVGETRTFRLGDLPRAGQPDERLAELGRLLRRGVSETAVLDSPEQVVTVLWPAVRVFVVGHGQIAEALSANAGLLGWRLTTVDAVDDLVLRASDNVVVLEHDLEISGAALIAALDRGCGYLGALGSRHTQAARADWLRSHGVSAERIASIHGPAGLNIGSRTPAEIALSILAEIVQVRAA